MGDTNSNSSSKAFFDEIEAALTSNDRGRAFLAEYRRRVRSEEFTTLLEAVGRLERSASNRDESLNREELRSLVAQVEETLRDTRLALLNSFMSGGRIAPVDQALSVSDYRRETTDVLSEAAELIQETSWALREAGFDSSLCGRLEAQTTSIYGVCRRQERMLDRVSTVDRSLARTEARVLELRRTLEPAIVRSATPKKRVSQRLVEGDIAFVRNSPDEETS